MNGVVHGTGLFDVDATNRSRQTALHLLARGGRTDLAEVRFDTEARQVLLSLC